MIRESNPFRHPDPDKLFRLLSNWNNGYYWTQQDVQEFEVLVGDWIRYYKLFGQTKEIEVLTARAKRIRKELQWQRPRKTASGVLFARPRQRIRGTTM